jgi:hypothetical protein
MPLRCWVDPSSRAKEFVGFIGYIWLFRSSFGLVALVVQGLNGRFCGRRFIAWYAVDEFVAP